MIVRQRVSLTVALAFFLALTAGAQDTAKIRLVYTGGQHEEVTVRNLGEFEALLQNFLEGEKDGIVTATSRMESGKDETIVWLKKVGEKVTFSKDEAEWISVEEAVERFRGAHAHTHLMTCQRHLEQLGAALDRWTQNHNGRLPARLEELTPGYVTVLPSCPAASQESTGYTYKTSEERRFLISCTSNHENAGMPLSFPAYDGVQGLIIP